MKFLFKERLSWRNQYDIYNEEGKVAFFVQAELPPSPITHIYDGQGREIGVLKHKTLHWPATYEMYVGGQYVGCIKKDPGVIHGRFYVDGKGWRVEGKHLSFEYTVFNPIGDVVATISKELFKTTDTYWINVKNPDDALYAVMVVLTIDDIKAMRKD